jgi:hypothetical protein
MDHESHGRGFNEIEHRHDLGSVVLQSHRGWMSVGRDIMNDGSHATRTA